MEIPTTKKNLLHTNHRQMKYLLINKQTGEKTLCGKITIDGFDYYVNDELPKLNDTVITTRGNIYYIKDDSKDFIEYVSKIGKKITATNDPNIDIPKVVDEVERLAQNYAKSRIDISTAWGSYADGYNKSQETHPFNEEDMKSFGTHFYTRRLQGIEETIDQSFQIWKSQQPKTVYYA